MKDIERLRQRLRAAGDYQGALHAEAADAIESLRIELEEARRDAARLLVACADLDGFLFDTKEKIDYVREAAAENGRESPTEEDELTGIRRMIDYQMNASYNDD